MHQLWILMSRQMKNQGKGYNKTKSCKPFWNAKCYQFYIYRWIYSQHNYPRYMQLPKHKWNKYHNYIYHWTWQILTATVFHSTHGVQKFIGEQTVFWILRSTETILHLKATHTHTHTKYLHCWKFYKCNNYKYIKHNPFLKSWMFY